MAPTDNSSELIRKTETVCPVCSGRIDGEIIGRGDGVFLARDCEEHGRFEFLLSNNREAYSDFERFYFRGLDPTRPDGRITRYWVFITPDCPVKCSYCSVEVRRPFFDRMTTEQFDEALQNFSEVRLTFAGGEPTAHPQLDQLYKSAACRDAYTELATNGIKLADPKYLDHLQQSGVKWVRISIDSLDRRQAEKLGAAHNYDATISALENLQTKKMTTTLAPTIFRGVNEDQIEACLEYALARPHVRELSVNGFSWVGEGRGAEKSMMIMPDEMMDILYRRYFDCDREDIFTFQKFLFLALRFSGIRLCLYTQLMLFVRTKNGIVPITSFLNMKRLRKVVDRWPEIKTKNLAAKFGVLSAAGASAIKPKSLRLLLPMLRMFLINVLQTEKIPFPSEIIPVVLNTNCSPLNADSAVGLQCMSGVIFVKDGQLYRETGTNVLLGKDAGLPLYSYSGKS